MRRSFIPSLTGAALSLAVLCGAGVSARADAPADYQRYSVRTPAGPEEPSPEIFRRVKRLLYAEHRIKKGESNAWSLAKKYGTTARSLQATTGDEMIILHPGMRVMVHNQDGLLYRVRKEREDLDSIAARYDREGSDRRKFKEEIVRINGLPASAMLGGFELSRDSLVLLPKVRINFDTYLFPFKGSGQPRVSSRYGDRRHPVLGRHRFHAGIDLAKPYGTPVYPARSGRVVDLGWREGYGLMVVVKHFDGATTLYGHLSKIATKKGRVVQRGKSEIGRVGSSGLATGPHLHFEMRDRSGRLLNPMSKIGKR